VNAKWKLIVYPNEKFDLVMDAWADVMNSPNQGKYMQCLTLFEKFCTSFPTLGNYVKDTWLIPHNEIFSTTDR